MTRKAADIIEAEAGGQQLGGERKRGIDRVIMLLALLKHRDARWRHRQDDQH